MIQYLKRVTDRKAELLTKEKFKELVTDASVEVNVRLARQCLAEGNKEGYQKAKALLPCVQWVGYDATGNGSRKADQLTPTQLFMVDIDHMTVDPREAWKEILAEASQKDAFLLGIKLVHVTPSGAGLRIVAQAIQLFETVVEHMDWLVKELNLEKYGKYDSVCKDLSRCSFLVNSEEFLMYEDDIFDTDVNGPIKQGGTTATKTDAPAVVVNMDDSEEYKTYREQNYRGTRLTTIVDKYVEVYGEPGEGEKHNYYNEMVKNFRTIADNNPKVLHAILPRFGHGYEETLSQCQSICRTNTLSRIPKDFYFFLKDNGFYERRKTATEQEREKAALDAPAEVDTLQGMPELPPVFKEIIGTMPKDFKVPGINGLMPILGTLTSHLRAEYPYDLRMHSTEFFSIIYAPPATGKGFLERHMDVLLEDLKLRDMLSNERENIYNKIVSKKGSNEKSPDNPRVTLRIVAPKQSETDFLEKQQANKGHHMFTYAPEMDSWRKGVKAAGGNKDDMIRIAWDNGEYGQNFKSPNSFKGTVNLYWNVLICGTSDQLDAYFKNVENGLVTRCSFTAIENQEFVDAPGFKKLSARDLRVIHAFMERCDSANYKDPLDFDPSLLMSINEDDFDKEVPWRYQWKDFKVVDMKWIMPTINKFLKEQLSKSALDIDHARDSFRRRAAVRGFRLALLCTECWKSVGVKERKIIKDFVAWWMRQDIENILKLFGAKYNDRYDQTTSDITQRTVYDLLGDKFTREDVYVASQKCGKKTKPRRIIFDWIKLNVVKPTDVEGCYVKVKKKNEK